jgi:pimeloyl-ACP methyl ester carboxylesterase
MRPDPVPAILVHGWNSHPGVWNRLGRRLDSAGIPHERFRFGTDPSMDIPTLAGAFRGHLREWRDRTGYYGDVDIVCHSIGTLVARCCAEVPDGSGHYERVRQLIGIGPLNHGSALAELCHDPGRGEEIVKRMQGVFAPGQFDPASDPIVQDIRPGSRFLAGPGAAGLRKDIAYRVVISSNPEGIPAFFPLFSGRTWEFGDDGMYRLTCDGDGIVPARESALPGVLPDHIPLPHDPSGEYADAGLYSHVSLPKNPVVIDRVLHYLEAGEGKNGVQARLGQG